MYTGTMMDDLFAMVSRAEEHADAQPQEKAAPVRAEVHATYTYEFTYDETLVGVA
jgi:hypothetical protein